MQATVASTQPLTGDLAAFLAYLHRATMGGWFQTVSELDLSLTQLKALQVLGKIEEPSVKELGASLGLSLPAASRAVDGLLGRGLVERRECAADRRIRLVRLSSDGRDALERVLQARLEDLDAFVAGLPAEDRDRLAAALAPIVERAAAR